MVYRTSSKVQLFTVHFNDFLVTDIKSITFHTNCKLQAYLINNFFFKITNYHILAPALIKNINRELLTISLDGRTIISLLFFSF